MPKKASTEIIASRYFRWRLYKRGNTLYADGRSNRIKLGRHSLETGDHQEAMRLLSQLDLRMAVQHGLADPAQLKTSGARSLPLTEGIQLYMTSLGRPEVAGGASWETQKRYRAVFDKLEVFADQRGAASWNDVTKDVLTAYLQHLQRQGYADRTLYLEGTTIRQAMKWLVGEGHLPAECLFRMRLVKPHGTTTYCYTHAEVQAMIQICRGRPDLAWLADVIIAFARTGLRISELAQLRWGNVDVRSNTITIRNDPSAPARSGVARRRTKNRRDRSFPIHADLQAVLIPMSRHRDGYVFHGPRGGRLKPDTVRNVLVREVITPLKGEFPTPDGEVGFEHGRLHSFRHYFCSACANSGVPEQAAMDWLGHQDSKMVRHYYHLHDAEAQRQMNRVKFADEPDGSGAVA